MFDPVTLMNQINQVPDNPSCSVLLDDLLAIHFVPSCHLLMLKSSVAIEEELVSVGGEKTLQWISGSHPTKMSLD